MIQNPGQAMPPAKKVVRTSAATRKHYAAAEKIRNVLKGLRGEEGIAELCWRVGGACQGP